MQILSSQQTRLLSVYYVFSKKRIRTKRAAYVLQKGLRVFCVGNGFFCYGGLVGFFFATVGVGFFCDSAGGVFCDSGRAFGYGKEGDLHQWWFSATVTGVYYIGTGPQRSGASRRLIFVGDCDKQEAAIHCS